MTPSQTREPVRLGRPPVVSSNNVVRAPIRVVITMAYTSAPNDRHTMIPVQAVGRAKKKNDNE
jgi:hypothetical protein